MAHDENVREDYRPLTGREREILEMLLSVEAPGMNQLRVASGVGFPGSTLLVASQPWIGRAMLSPESSAASQPFSQPCASVSDGSGRSGGCQIA
jgi:hypothetical protein